MKERYMELEHMVNICMFSVHGENRNTVIADKGFTWI